MSGKKGIVLAALDAASLAIKFLEEQSIICINLEHVICPRLGSIDWTRSDEPEAFPGLDFTRKKSIGQRVLVNTSRKLDITRNQVSFGKLSVQIGKVSLFDENNADLAYIVVENGFAKVKENSPSDDYVSSLRSAEISAKNAKKGIWSERNFIRKHLETNPTQLIKQNSFEGFVESVINASQLIVCLYPSYESVKVQLAGIRTPMYKKMGSDTFGVEAKDFVETRLLQREVKIKLFLFQENNCYIGQIIHPRGDISVFLLEEGLAQISNQTMTYVNESSQYREAESNAKKNKKNLWRSYSAALQKNIRGKVEQIKGSNQLILSGDKKIWLNNVRVPSFFTNSQCEAGGFEARELVRKLTIGKEVLAVIDYVNEDKSFATVYVGDVCVQEELVKLGYATVFVPKNAATSDRIDFMLKEEEQFKAKKVSPPKPIQLNDLSNKHSRQRSFPFLHFVQDKVQDAVIEYFVNSTRLVVSIFKHNALLRMDLIGVSGRDPQDKIGVQALEYMNATYLQRDVEILVGSVAQSGVFRGQVKYNDHPIELDLLERGFASIHTPSVQKIDYKNEMFELEKSARKQKLGIWNEVVVSKLARGEKYKCKVVDIVNSTTLQIRIENEECARVMQALPKATEKVETLLKGDIMVGLFQDVPYRVRVTKIDTLVYCEFIDLGTYDRIQKTDLRKLPEDIKSIQPLAIQVRLGGIKSFELDDEFEENVVNTIWDKVEDKEVWVHLMDEGSFPEVLVTDSAEISSGSINSILVADGLTDVDSIDYPAPYDAIVEELNALAHEAKESRKGAWSYGNVSTH